MQHKSHVSQVASILDLVKNNNNNYKNKMKKKKKTVRDILYSFGLILPQNCLDLNPDEYAAQAAVVTFTVSFIIVPELVRQRPHFPALPSHPRAEGNKLSLGFVKC